MVSIKIKMVFTRVYRCCVYVSIQTAQR